MRILLLTSEFPPGPGGIGTHAYQLALQLTDLGWDVTVFASQAFASDAAIAAFNARQPFTVQRIRALPGAPFKLIYRWQLISRWVRRHKPAVLLASGDRDVYLAAALARRHGLPWVAVEHGRYPAAWERVLKRLSLRQADAIVAVSNYTYERLLAMGVRPRAARVIPNGADPVQFGILPAAEVLAFKEKLALVGTRILLTVGSVTDRKGQDVVIRSLPLILQQADNTYYLLAGRPSKEPEFARLANELGVADHVRFLGQVAAEDLLRLLNACDVFVLTSRHTADEFEGYGIAVVEAGMCAKPAVVSAGSGVAEAIVAGETGLSVPEEDVVATANAILALLQDENLRETMGHAAQKRALLECTWRQRVREYDSLLNEVVQAVVIPPAVLTPKGAADGQS